ncbi:unnamed protein product, partial [Rotaria sp. Silwood1]
MVQEGTAFSWLKQRACDDLHLSDEQRGFFMPRFLDVPGIHAAKTEIFSGENIRALRDGEASDIIRQ